MSMSTGVEPTIDVKVFVDKERSKVLFAESGKGFVDVLFGFLTLPLGTVVRLLGGKSQVGCLDELYGSVEGLSSDLFWTEACKAMLLRPINAAAKQCCQLTVRVDDTKHREVYVCADTSCSVTAFSSVPGVVCRCGNVMAKLAGERPENRPNAAAGGAGEDGVFVKGGMKFIVTDDLNVAPASTSLMLSLLDKFQVPDPSCLEQRTLQLSSDKIIDLLRRSLTSKNPLTDHCLDVAVEPDDSVIDMLILPKYMRLEEQDDDTEHIASIRVLQTKNNSKVLYAEVGGDFVDLLSGLLTIPLGSIMNTYGKSSSKGCLDNLYSNINGSAQECLRPECQDLLLSPMLAPFFGCGASKMLQVEELAPDKQEIKACFKCFKDRGFASLSHCHGKFWYKKSYHQYCNEMMKTTNLYELDPKTPKGGCDDKEAYVKQGPQKFIVTDDLCVLPLSLASTLQVVIEAKLQRKDLVEKEVAVTKTQVMELLRAALVTRRALSTVLLPSIPKMNKKLHYHSFGLY